MGQPSFIQIGYVQGVFGIKGWLKVYSYCRPKEQILEYSSWQLHFNNGEKTYPLEQGKLHGAAIIAKLVGIDTRTEAELLNRATIWVPITELAQPAEGEYYWYQLIGLKVVNIEGQPIGEIEHIMETGANDVLVIMNDADKKQILIPYIRGEVVKEVSLDQKFMIVDWQIDY